MATAARAFYLSKITNPHHRQQQSSSSSPPFSRHLILRPTRPSLTRARSCSSGGAVRCLISGVDGGGVSDDFVVSTRKSGFGREFSVIANMLLRVEALDNSVISKGVSDSAKDSMKQTISSMLGLLPSDQFSVVVRVLKRPLHQLLVSSIITGYTLWNAEYRIALVRNFDIDNDKLGSSDCFKNLEVSELRIEGCEGEDCEVGDADKCEDSDKRNDRLLANMSPEALRYIQQLESDLYIAQKELSAQKKESIKVESDKKNNNDLLEYLRSLESHMVTELSRPSSLEVEEIVQQLVQNIMQKFSKDDTTSNFTVDSTIENIGKYKDDDHDDDGEVSYTISTSRDYLAKLLFWCMLLGHHLRGLENRLHLSCAVGLL